MLRYEIIMTIMHEDTQMKFHRPKKNQIGLRESWKEYYNKLLVIAVKKYYTCRHGRKNSIMYGTITAVKQTPQNILLTP